MSILLLAAIVDILLSVISYFYYRKTLKPAYPKIFTVLFLILTFLAWYSFILPAHWPFWLLQLISLIAGFWLAFTFYSVILALLHLITLLAGKSWHRQLPGKSFAICGLIIVIAFMAWGNYRAFHPNIRTEKITTTKLSPNTHYKIVLLSDLHLGQILGAYYVNHLVQYVQSLHPDVIVIAGDVMDKKIDYVVAGRSLQALKKLQAPLGTYIAFGNHDYFDMPFQWQLLLQQQGFVILRDQAVIVDKNLKITGLNDFSQNKRINSLNRLAIANENYYSILLDHQPRKTLAARDAGYDLYLSGHTHTGQLFPLRLITKNMYLLDYGRKDMGSFTAVTTSGYGFWGPPLRTEAAPEIVVLEIIGKEKA